MDFLEFLISAKKKTYASSKIINKLTKDGAKELVFEKENFKYIDRYYGYNPFSGQEIVLQDNKVIWSMNYYGFVDSLEPLEKQVYSFLKLALQQVEERFPFRGPSYFKKDSFEYFSDTKGDLKHFVGKEYILYNNETIYVCYYHGGVVKDK